MINPARADLDAAAELLEGVMLTGKASDGVVRLAAAVLTRRRALGNPPVRWELWNARDLRQRAEQATQHRREHAQPAQIDATARTRVGGSAGNPTHHVPHQPRTRASRSDDATTTVTVSSHMTESD